MIQQHWKHHNSFEHYGHGSIDMLGWDALVVDPKIQIQIFSFDSHNKIQMKEQLLEALPKELYGLASHEPVTIDALRYKVANQTAASFSTIDDIIRQLRNEHEIDLIGSDDKKHSFFI